MTASKGEFMRLKLIDLQEIIDRIFEDGWVVVWPLGDL